MREMGDRFNFKNQFITNRRGKMKQILALALGILLIGAYRAPATADDGFSLQLGYEVKVMTQNLYIGTNLFRVLEEDTGAPPDPLWIPKKVAETFNVLIKTNFPERAKALANEIANNLPDLIGLQEVWLIRRQSPGDFLLGNPLPADEMILDYLEIMLGELKALELDYEVVAINENTDVELPMLAGFNPNTDPFFDDVRITDFDVILARSNVATSNVTKDNYPVNYQVPVGPVSVEFKRGFVAVDATIRGRNYRFVNTHLELPGQGYERIQTAQAQELIKKLASETLPVILVGDFNSSPEHPVTGAYGLISNKGYADVWPIGLRGRRNPGFTCCQEEILTNEKSVLNERFDHIFIRNDFEALPLSIVGPVVAHVVGDKQKDKTDSGLWPSDHAGVVATLRIPVPREQD